MIANDKEFAVTHERIAMFEDMLEQFRKTERPENWPALSSGYLAEIERMQREILDYLARPVSGPKRTTAA
jgi:hypothetical protein